MAEAFSTPQTVQPLESRASRRPRRRNVGQAERIASVLGGSVLTLYGLTRGSLKGLLVAAAGGGLMYRGTSGTDEEMTGREATTKEPLREIRISEALTVNRARGEVYEFWKDLENLPRFMRHLESVRRMDEKRSVWTARGTKGMENLTWEAEITEDRPGEVIAWHSLPGADIENAGMILFEPGPRGEGTVVRVVLEYRPSGLAGMAAKMINPVLSQMIREDTRRFKSLMEAGEIPTIEGQPMGS